MSTHEDPPDPQPADDETVSYSQARRTTSDPSAESRPSTGDPERYKLGPLLGQGGMATVLEAEDTRLERTVAVKCMKPSIAGDPDLRRRTPARFRSSISAKTMSRSMRWSVCRARH
jgi:serine/threonine protein kinase